LKTVTPTDEYIELYQKIKKEVSKMGLDYSLVGSRRH
jgi:hypothetical protein